MMWLTSRDWLEMREFIQPMIHATQNASEPARNTSTAKVGSVRIIALDSSSNFAPRTQALNGSDQIAQFVAGDAGSFPGPDWMPKQAHMADLQAKAAAENLLLALNGKAPTARFKVELICIVDTLSSGILVYRDLKRSLLFPSLRMFHWAKRFFERHYLKAFRE